MFYVRFSSPSGQSTIEFEFTPDISVDAVEKIMRSGCGVTGGFLSSLEDRTSRVSILAPGSYYYFRDFNIFSLLPGKTVTFFFRDVNFLIKLY